MNENAQISAIPYPLGLFEGAGIELEYMIVDSETLDVLPVCDRVLHDISGSFDNEVFPGGVNGFSSWSNELALHVIEFKSRIPIVQLNEAADKFQDQVSDANLMLEKYNGRLLSTAMHPWMNPEREFQIWPHGNRDIYSTFDRIFGCKGHGWSNLQSMHINLPFRDNSEFIKLHTAVRVLLPVLSALTASSPLIEGRFSGFYDTRLEVYRTNSIRIPSITGSIIPEPVQSIDEYNKVILNKIYSDLEIFDQEKVISEEWVNARGCIARFSRGSIEIRTCDIQECPGADIACADLFIEVLKKLVYEEISSTGKQLNAETASLYKIMLSIIKNGPSAVIDDSYYLSIFGLKKPCTALIFWEEMAQKFYPHSTPLSGFLQNIFRYGPISERILKAAGNNPDHNKLHSIYMKIAESLAAGTQFIP